MGTSRIPRTTRRFVDYFGELGPRWGLPAEACQLHAYLYLLAEPKTAVELAADLSFSQAQVESAAAFLLDYRMITGVGSAAWRTSADPWDMLMRGMEERRQRELPAALEILRACHIEALADPKTKQTTATQIGKMLGLVRDLAAIESQAQRLSPQMMRGLVGLSGRAARFMDRALGGKRRGEG